MTLPISSNLIENLTVKDIEKELDKLISEIVILRDRKCVQCGSRNNLGAGHVFPRRVRAVRWDLSNVFAQCNMCNHNHNLDRELYYDTVKTLIGRSAFEKLENSWNRSRKLDYIELLSILELMRRTKENLQQFKRFACELTYKHHLFIYNDCFFCHAHINEIEEQNNGN